MHRIQLARFRSERSGLLSQIDSVEHLCFGYFSERPVAAAPVMLCFDDHHVDSESS